MASSVEERRKYWEEYYKQITSDPNARKLLVDKKLKEEFNSIPNKEENNKQNSIATQILSSSLPQKNDTNIGISEISITELMALLFEKVPNTTNTSHYISSGADITIRMLEEKLRPIVKKQIPINACWNLGMIILGEVLGKLPEGWENEVRGFSGNMQIVFSKLLELILKELRDGE